MHLTTEAIFQIVTALVPLIVAVLGILMKLSHEDREELSHAALCGALHKAAYAESMIMLIEGQNVL